MRFSNKLVAGVLGLLVSFQAMAVGVSVGEAILRGLTDDVSKSLEKKGLVASQKAVWSSFEKSTTRLNKDAKPTTVDMLKAMVAGNKKLTAILEKDLDQATDREIAQLHDELVIKSTKIKSGRNFVGCNECLSGHPDAQKFGITVLARDVNQSTGKLIAAAPVGKELQVQILAKARGLKMALDPASLSRMNEVQKGELWVALNKTSSGSATEKKLGQAIQKFSASGGESYLEPKLYLLLLEDLGESDMDRMSTLLNRLYTEESKSEANRIKNLQAWFEGNADTTELKDALRNLKDKNCWGIF